MKALSELSYEALDEAKAVIVEETQDPRLGAMYFAQGQETMSSASNLVAKLRSLEKHMGQLADRVERDPLGSSINGLGEVQTLGSMVDAACGTHKAMLESLRRMEIYLGAND